MTCPVCGAKSYREGRMCPEHSGHSVCIACCKSCECYDDGLLPCRYYIVHPEKKPKNYSAEIYKINRRIEEKKKVKCAAEAKKRWYYAEQIRGEIGHLINDRNYLEEEREKHEKRN